MLQEWSKGIVLALELDSKKIVADVRGIVVSVRCVLVRRGFDVSMSANTAWEDGLYTCQGMIKLAFKR